MLLTPSVTSGCLDLPEIQYETEHLRIGTKFDGPLCRGDLDHLEHLVGTLEEQFDTTVDEPIEIYLWGVANPDPPAWCEEDWAQACFSSSGRIFGDESSVEHELVHAVIHTFGDPAPIWDEGAAESFAVTRTYREDSSPPSASLDSEVPSYLTAGHFSRWLLNTYGLESYRALLAHPGSAREAFETTYGVRLAGDQSLSDQGNHLVELGAGDADSFVGLCGGVAAQGSGQAQQDLDAGVWDTGEF